MDEDKVEIRKRRGHEEELEKDEDKVELIKRRGHEEEEYEAKKKK